MLYFLEHDSKYMLVQFYHWRDVETIDHEMMMPVDVDIHSKKYGLKEEQR